MNGNDTKLLVEPIVDNNPITLQILGICSALAVTTKLAPAITMSIALTAVIVGASVIISLIRHHMPSSIRIIIQMTIIASLVIVVDQVLQAFAYELSKQLSVFVGLIITNCIVLGRAEGFALSNPPGRALIDGIAGGLGYAWILALVATMRELLGSGRVLGFDVVPAWMLEAGYVNNGIMVLAPGAFFLLGVIVWIQRAITGHAEDE
jgi:Na+-transporting NADH:ubiquinone oxidoreductase subunit D